MGKSYLVEGARLRCLCGSKCSNLKVLLGHGYTAGGKKKASCTDCLAVINIPYFGQCMMNKEGGTCKGFMKLASRWRNKGGSSWKLELLNDENALTMDSFLICKRGGIIAPETSGQGDVQKINWMEFFDKYLDELLAALGRADACMFGGDPVNLNTGNYIYEKKDLVIPGITELSFHMFYNSMDTYRDGSLGEGWHHNYEIFLEQRGAGILHLHLGDGRRVVYRQNIGAVYTPLSGGSGLLRKDREGYRYIAKDSTEIFFDEDGLILSAKDRNRNITVFKHDAQGRLQEVRGANGGTLNYHYNKEGNLYRVCDHTGREVRLQYSYRVLQKFVNSLGQVYTYGYNENLRLESVTTPRGIVGVRNTYDSINRVTKQYMPDGGEIELKYDEEGMCTYIRDQNGSITAYECDDRFRNTRTVYHDGEEQFRYNDNGQRILYVDKNGNQTRYGYDTKGNLVEIRNALGGVAEFQYNNDNRIARIRFPGGGCIVNDYDANGNLRSRTDQSGGVVVTDYNSRNQPVSITQPDGSRVCIDYDERGNIRCITDPMGHHTVYEYDRLNRVSATIDGNGNKTEFFYNEQNDLVKVINPSGDVCSYEYSPSGKMTQITDFDGSVRKMWYDVCNRPEGYENQEGNRVTYTRDMMGRLASEKLPNGAETRYVHDRNGRLVEYVDQMGGKTRFTYDPCGNQIQTEDAEGGKTSFVYDALNRMIEETDPVGNCTRYEYDADGHLTGITDALGNKRSMEYDQAGRKVKERDALGNVISYHYNSMGLVTQVKNASGGIISYEYYPGGLLKKVAYPNGKRLHFTYDGNRNIKEKWDEQGACLYYEYDEQDRVKAVRNKEGQQILYGYDAIGNVTSVTDAEGNTTRYEYSPIGKLLSVEDANGNLTRYSYDMMGDLTAVFRTGNEAERKMAFEEAIQLNARHHNLHLTLYGRDLAGRVSSVTDALGHQEFYEYDKTGRLVKRQDKEGYVSSFAYRADGRIGRVSFDDGRSAEYSYGPMGQLKEVKDWLGTLRMEHDAYGRLVKTTDHRGRTTAYEWGSMNERKALIYPDGSRVDYEYDDLSRINAVRSNKERTEYRYGEQGGLAERICSGGLVTSYRYDREGRLDSLSHRYHGRILERCQYKYNARGYKTEVDRYRWDKPEESGVYRYLYDPVGQLTGVEKDGAFLRQYEYDVFHNRTAMTQDEQRTEYAYNASDQLISMTGAEHYDYRYDRRGNLIEVLKGEEQERAYVFDAAGRITMAREALAGECSFLYNGLGNRISADMKSAGNGIRTEYYYDMTKQHHNLLMQEGGNNKQKYLWGIDFEGMEDDRGQSRALLDEMGSPLRFLWKNGNVLSCYGYDEFGRDLYGNIGKEQPFGYTGYTFDAIGGMYYAQAREYLPEQGRFSGADILKGDAKMPVTLNEYIYCRNSALNYLDFLGTTEDISNDRWWECMLWGTEADKLLKDHLKEHAQNNGLTIKTSVHIPQGLNSDNPYYHTMSGYGYADIIYVNDGTAEVYELKHESAYGRIDGSLQLKGYIWAINNSIDTTQWLDNTVEKGAIPGKELNSIIDNFTAESKIHGGKTIRYYTSGFFPGMVFWTYVDRKPDEEFNKVLKEDAEKLEKKVFRLLEEKQKVTAINPALEITGLIIALAFLAGNDAVGMVGDDAAIPVILAMLVARFNEIFGSCDTSA